MGQERLMVDEEDLERLSGRREPSCPDAGGGGNVPVKNSLTKSKLLMAALSVTAALVLISFEGDSKEQNSDSRKAPAAGDTYVNPQDGSVLVWVPAGEFLMGSDEGDADEKPPHKVKLEGFWLGKFEVTNAQYAKFLEAEDHTEPMFWEHPKFNDPQRPVVGLTWSDAQSYCEWAGLRLPTEPEWEYAGSCGKRLKYATATGKINHDLCNYAGSSGKDRWEDTPAPVGSFPPNSWGLHDMAGNAWEWTSTFYKPYPYVSTDGREDTEEEYGLRVMRGGSWQFLERYCSTSYRRRFASHLKYDSSGFRTALTEAQRKRRP